MGKISKAQAMQIEHLIRTRDEIHGYSKGVKGIIDLGLSFIEYAEQVRKKGQNVVWARGAYESPIFYACDTIPLATTELARLGNPEAITIAEDQFQMPREICTMVKVIFGEYYLRRNSDIKKIYYISRQCDPQNICYQMLEDYGYERYCSDLGLKLYDTSDERYEKLLEVKKKDILATAKWASGRELNLNRLQKEMKRYNRIVRKVRTIMNLRLKHTTYIRSLPILYLTMGLGHYFGRPEEYEELLDVIIEEMSVLKSGEYNESKVGVVWSGGRGSDFTGYETIDNSGGCIVGFCTDNDYRREFNLKQDPLQSFAEFCFGGRNNRDFNGSSSVAEQEYKLTGAKGIVIYSYAGCYVSNIGDELQREYFKKKGIPALAMEGSFQAGEPSGQLITRVRAFIEMLQGGVEG